MPTSQAIPINMCTPQDIAENLFDPRIAEILQAVGKRFDELNLSSLLPQGAYSDEHRERMADGISILLSMMAHHQSPSAAIRASDPELDMFMELEALGLFRSFPIYVLPEQDKPECFSLVLDEEAAAAALLDKIDKKLSTLKDLVTGQPVPERDADDSLFNPAEDRTPCSFSVALDGHEFIVKAQLLDKLEQQVSALEGPTAGRPTQCIEAKSTAPGF